MATDSATPVIVRFGFWPTIGSGLELFALAWPCAKPLLLLKAVMLVIFALRRRDKDNISIFPASRLRGS